MGFVVKTNSDPQSSASFRTVRNVMTVVVTAVESNGAWVKEGRVPPKRERGGLENLRQSSVKNVLPFETVLQGAWCLWFEKGLSQICMISVSQAVREAKVEKSPSRLALTHFSPKVPWYQCSRICLK